MLVSSSAVVADQLVLFLNPGTCPNTALRRRLVLDESYASESCSRIEPHVPLALVFTREHIGHGRFPNRFDLGFDIRGAVTELGVGSKICRNLIG